MVYVKDSFSEEIQDVSIVIKDNIKYAYVISDRGILNIIFRL